MKGPYASIRALIDARADTDGTRTALLEPGGRTFDYATLRDEVRRVASALRAHGFRPGDRIAYAMPNGIDAVLAILGIQYAQLCAVAINLVAGRDTIAYALAHSGARLVLTSMGTRSAIQESLASTAFGEHAWLAVPPVLGLDALNENESTVDAPTDTVERADTVDDRAALAFAPDALLMYTSGTTGRPKGVRLSHANLLAGGRNTASGHALHAGDRALCTLPLFHINGLCVTLYAPLVSGGSVLLPERFSASRFWTWLRDGECSWFSVVPTQVAYLLHGEDRCVPGGRVRFGRSASAPLAPHVHRAFEQRFDVPLIETMGLTETAAQITTNPMPPAAGAIGSAGRAHGCELRIAAASVTGEGEIQVRGDSVMTGYLNDEVATHEAFSEDGWLRTGDLGRIDEHGFVFVTGRLKELIIKGGENIAPREIDEALLSHPDVLEAAAFGVPCDDFGERVEAAVVAVPGRVLDTEALLVLCEQRVGAFRRPDRLHRVEELPKGPSGKIQRRHCAALCANSCAVTEAV